MNRMQRFLLSLKNFKKNVSTLKFALIIAYYWLIKQKTLIKYLLIFLFILPYILILNIKTANNTNYRQHDQSLNIDNLTEKRYQAFVELWKEILTVSDEQNLIEPDIILKTAKFMIKEVPQDDPELIAFVRTLIVSPPGKPISLSNSNKTDQSDVGESPYIDNLLDNKRNGFFVEAGAFDGEFMSNSLFFELKRNWSGLLIEPIPSHFQRILSKNRNSYVINACIADHKPLIAKFKVLTVFSGRYSELDLNYKTRIEYENKNNHLHSNKTAYIPCFPLYTILKAINVSRVDYFSLDVEGGEWSVIESIPYDKIYIDALTVEWIAAKNTSELVINKLIKNNYEFYKADLRNMYFRRRPY